MIKDKFGNELTVGDSVYRAVTSVRTPVIYIAKVTEIRDGKLYLDDSKVPINYPSRLIQCCPCHLASIAREHSSPQ